ncbi:hypothetical protein [Embleya sp. NBC_00888]|uniref:hypothetical protein n=1 Tax=Embleya sp. NBC_00888 TaxID=2975960 RepID=UPI00386D72B5
MVGELRRREIGFCSLHERLDTTTPGGRLVFSAFQACLKSLTTAMRWAAAVVEACAARIRGAPRRPAGGTPPSRLRQMRPATVVGQAPGFSMASCCCRDKAYQRV